MGGKQLGSSDYELTTNKKQTSGQRSPLRWGTGAMAVTERLDLALLHQGKQEGRTLL